MTCFVEYNWTALCWSFRIGDRFTDYRGTRSLPTLKEWRELLELDGITLTKTDSRTWRLDEARRT